MNNVVLAADLGGTNMRMAAVSPDGGILSRAHSETPPEVSPDELISLTLRLISECSEHLKGSHQIGALAFASPAPAAVDSNGILTKLPNLPTLNGMDLRARLREHLPYKIVLENDATAAAVGEHWLGVSKGFENVIHVTLGTGVGGGLILNGNPYRGVDGTAGEIGHICVEPEGITCGCGSRGCLEQYASATAVERLANEKGLSVDNSYAAYIFAIEGNPLAVETFRFAGSYLGIALAGLINTLNPEMIVIGGGMSAGWDALQPSVLNEIRSRAFREPAERVKIVTTELGDDAGLIGAAWSALNKGNPFY